ncbi:ABCC1 [Lepeophtheirus salmonis]|uniref:ABCC1 n=1 Tax=Lepeophtheirus salmonis TaxID=72036 RepID=A0A7R8HAB9_LEPSM|nr:ABCC1 [Lepeophtheirus salmonis]CAF2969565.1 ABCC1 [Lepeophtheirus salmonis]
MITSFGFSLFLHVDGVIRRCSKTSTLQFFFYFLLLISSCLSIRRIESHPEDLGRDYLWLICLQTGCVLVATVLYSISETVLKQKSKKNKENPKKDASFFSLLFYEWITPLLWKGFKKPITEDDLWNLNKDLTCGETSRRLDQYYFKSGNKKIGIPLMKAFGFEFVIGSTIKFFSDILSMVLPQIMKLMINHADSEFEMKERSWKGYLYPSWAIIGGTGILLITIPVNAILSYFGKKFQMKQMKAKDNRTKILNEVLGGIRILKLYAWEPSYINKIEGIRGVEIGILKKAAWLTSFMGFIWSSTPFIVALASFATFVMVDDRNILTAEKAFVTQSYINKMKMPMAAFPFVIVAAISATVSLKRINQLLTSDELQKDAVERVPMKINQKIDQGDAIVIRDGNFKWSTEDSENTLSNINLRIKHGSLTAIVEMVKKSGKVRIKGQIAYVPQESWMQNTSLKNNILFGKPYDEEWYNQVLEYCCLTYDLSLLPAGDETEIGERGINLSGGQRQRISLARAIYSDADVYIFDNPLSALDSQVGKSVFNNVLNNNTGIIKDKTRLLVTHGISYLPHVHHIAVMLKGEIIHEGTYQELSGLLMLNQLFGFGSSIWLEAWTQEDYGNATIPKYRDLYLGVYGALGIGQAVTIFLLSLSVAMFTLKASKVIHNQTQLKRLQSVTRSPIYSHFSESLNGLSSIRAYGAQSKFILESINKIDTNQRCNYPSIIANRWLAMRLETIGNLCIFGAAILTMTNPELVGPGKIETNIVAVERLKEYAGLDIEKEWRLHKDTSYNWPSQGKVEFKNYSLRYKANSDLVLKKINFTIFGGERVGIVGRTGAGKSSLSVALFRIVEAANVEHLEAIWIPKMRFSDHDIWNTLGSVHLKEYIRDLKDGLNHSISEGGLNLSSGQRQLMCLARALLRSCKILILDEATAAVDWETDEKIQETIRCYFPSCTILTIAHRLKTIIDYDKILVLDKGTVIEFGSPNEFNASSNSILTDKNYILCLCLKDRNYIKFSFTDWTEKKEGMKIDIHNHILPETWPNLKEKYGYDGWVQMDHKKCQEKGKADMMRNGKFFRRVDSNCWDPEIRIKDMNRDGISIQALSTVPIMFNYWAKPEDTLDFSRFLNDNLASTVQKYPTRFVALGTIPAQAPKLAIEEMKKEDPELFPIYKTAEDLNACLFIHPWDMQMGGRNSKYWLPWLNAYRFPRLKICFAHGGGSFPYTLGRIDHGFAVRPDLCATDTNIAPRKFIGKFYTDSLVHDTTALDFWSKLLEKIALF